MFRSRKRECMSTNVKKYKSFHLIDNEYKNIAKKFLIDITSKEVLDNILKGKTSISKKSNYNEKVVVKNKNRNVCMYFFEPDNFTSEKLPVIYYMHGGGYLMGDAQMNDNILKEIANRNGIKVVSVEYTLATELSFPQDLEDSYIGLKYLFENSQKLGIDNKKIILMGESAGGGLAARLSLKLRDEKIKFIVGQLLIAPMIDYRTGGKNCPYENSYAGEFVWTKCSNQFAWRTLAGNRKISENEIPYFSPIMASNFEDLPNTVIIVGSLDLFVDENIEFSKRLLKAGVNVDLNVISGVFHLFQSINPNSNKAKFFKELRDRYIQKLLK